MKIKFSIYWKSDGNVLQEGETVNDNDDTREDKTLYNGVNTLMWLFTGRDDDFDPLTIRKISTEVIDNE